MNKIKVKIKMEDDRTILPTYTHDGDACMDLRVLIDKNLAIPQVVIKRGETQIFDTGLKFQIPENHVLKIYPRSGLGIKHGIILANLTGIIDSNFTETVKVALKNTGKEDFIIENNDRVAQFQVVPYPKMIIEEVDEIEDSGRGEGIGSSGVK